MAVTERAAVPGMTLADSWRSFKTAIRLGWAIESNWSDPFLFAVYTMAKPLAAAGILVVMFQVISQGRNPEFLQFLVVGSALWNVVFGVMAGLVQSILEDRERYRMIKYVVVTPTSLFPFLLGRSLARVIVSFVAVVLTLVVGVIFLGIRLEPDLLYLVPAMVVGVLSVVGLGIFMAGWCLQLRQEAWHYPEAIAGALYLISGAIFPFLLGRSLARVLLSVVAVILTLGVGVVFLQVELRPNLVYLVPATLIGVISVMGLGIFMAGWCLQLRQEAWHYPEAIAGALYLVSGAIFPIDVLPSFLHPIAFASPTTWWLEASRRGLLGHGSPGVLGGLSDGTVMLLLIVSTAVAIPLALAAFAWFMRRARQAGLLDMVTGS